MTDDQYLDYIETKLENGEVQDYEVHDFIHFLETSIGNLRSKSRLPSVSFKMIKDDIEIINSLEKSSIDDIQCSICILRLHIQLLIETMEKYIFSLRNL